MSDYLQPQIDALQAQLHDAAAALGQARLSGVDAVTLAAYQMRFDALKSQIDALVQQEGAIEAAPSVASRIGDLQTVIAKTANGVGQLVSDLATATGQGIKALGNSLSLLPLLLLGGAALLGWLVYKGKLKIPDIRL